MTIRNYVALNSNSSHLTETQSYVEFEGDIFRRQVGWRQLAHEDGGFASILYYPSYKVKKTITAMLASIGLFLIVMRAVTDFVDIPQEVRQP